MIRVFLRLYWIPIICLGLLACNRDQDASLEPTTEIIKLNPDTMHDHRILEQNALRNAYFGDLHVHSNNSLDAYSLAGVRASTDDAYRFEETMFANDQESRASTGYGTLIPTNSQETPVTCHRSL